MKKLSEMTLEELWQLFPIFLVEHKYEWEQQYEDMELKLTEALKDKKVLRISHIGSTSISNIYAKNIVDILVEISDDEDMGKTGDAIINMGFKKMSQAENRISFNYGYTQQGFADKVYHLHLRFFGDNDELYFKDYLIAYPQIAKQYERLKLELAEKYEHNRDAYTDAKTDFIKKYTLIAKQEFKDRY